MNTLIEKILKDRYFIKGENVDSWLRRVSTTIAGVEGDKSDYYEEEFYNIMRRGSFLPNTPTLSNAGKPKMGLSACFVLPLEDDLDQLLDTIANTGRIFKSGGGVGVSGAKVRPYGAIVSSSGGKASGPISYLEVIDAMTRTVSQGGTRRGANMGTLPYNHPDIIRFITSKMNGTTLSQYNISVTLTNDFMDTLLFVLKEREKVGNELFDITFPLMWNGEVWVSPEDVSINDEVLYKAGEEAHIGHAKMWEILVHCAYTSADPGVLFIDTANRENYLKDLYGEYLGTNPCGEQWLFPYDSCNLGSINVASFYDPYTLGKFDWVEFEKTVRLAVRFLDNVITANYYPLEEIDRVSNDLRRIGLGVMGYADLLALMGIPYDDSEAFVFGEKLFQKLHHIAVKASEELGKEKGVFPAYERSKGCQENMKPRRNYNVTTVAPTGTISLLIGATSTGTFKNGCSGGIEPHFSLAFYRNQGGATFLDINQILIYKLRVAGLKESDIQRVGERLANGEAFRDIIPDYEIPAEYVDIFKTSQEIAPKDHLAHQIIAQKHIDNAISKTINMPHSSSKQDVSTVYLEAYKGGCKGVTVYRDGSKTNQPLSNVNNNNNNNTTTTTTTTTNQTFYEQVDFKEPLPAISIPMKTSLGTLHTFTTLHPEHSLPLEVFLVLGRSGTDTQAFTEALGRLISVALRNGITTEEIAKQLIGIGGSTSTGFGESKTLSVPDAVGRMLLKTWSNEGTDEDTGEGTVNVDAIDEFCPECHNILVHSEGCIKCLSCGYTKC